ncbi:MAG: IS3 family transposase [Tannerellaceae bacterium]|nr:IS3 family transposase [Tannerellaceae bacterium]
MFGVTRQSYYQRQEVDFHRQAIQEMILYYVRQVREDFPRMGYLKLYEKSKWFFQDEFTLGRDAFYHLLRERGLMLKLKKRKARTTDSSHRFFRYKNLVKDFTATAPCRLWVADITYIRLEDGFCYLSLVTDGFSRKIVGWRLSDSLKYVHTRKALEMAIEEAGKEKHSLVGLIHHSDRGVQYAYPDYTDLLCAHRCRISMTQSGDPLENALAERMNGILKQEWLHCHHFTCIEQAQIAVEKAIRLYNTQRPHAALGMKTPQMVHLNQPYQKEEYQIPYPSQETPCGTGAAAPPQRGAIPER